MKIYIASGNANKVKEITAVLDSQASLSNIEIHSIQGMSIPEPDEPYATFMENACHKAQYYSDYTKQATLSEDAGLCIEALDDFPGVYTKDFAMDCGSFANAFAKLEDMLKGKANYNAYFICAAALYIPAEKRFIQYTGKVYGILTFPARGNNGFAFDPIFMPNGYTQTMAELASAVKMDIGHRAIAMRGIAQQLQDEFNKRTT